MGARRRGAIAASLIQNTNKIKKKKKENENNNVLGKKTTSELKGVFVLFNDVFFYLKEVLTTALLIFSERRYISES